MIDVTNMYQFVLSLSLELTNNMSTQLHTSLDQQSSWLEQSTRSTIVAESNGGTGGKCVPVWAGVDFPTLYQNLRDSYKRL